MDSIDQEIATAQGEAWLMIAVLANVVAGFLYFIVGSV